MDDILEHFRRSNAFLEGHFVLSSGLHSPGYLQCALALQRASDAADFGNMIADRFRGTEITTVASPAIGGLIIGYAVAQSLGGRFIWTERREGVMTLRRGFTLKPGEKILVVEDVITTGGSTRECVEALKENGGEVVAAASVIDRSNGTADVGIPLVSLLKIDVPTYRAEECPMCARGEATNKPGSRN
jgi:orotate phosphoribosyltransferase